MSGYSSAACFSAAAIQLLKVATSAPPEMMPYWPFSSAALAISSMTVLPSDSSLACETKTLRLESGASASAVAILTPASCALVIELLIEVGSRGETAMAS